MDLRSLDGKALRAGRKANGFTPLLQIGEALHLLGAGRRVRIGRSLQNLFHVVDFQQKHLPFFQEKNTTGAFLKQVQIIFKKGLANSQTMLYNLSCAWGCSSAG